MIADKIKNARTIKNLHRNRLLKISMFPGRLFLTGKMGIPIVKDTTPNITNSRLNNIS